MDMFSRLGVSIVGTYYRPDSHTHVIGLTGGGEVLLHKDYFPDKTTLPFLDEKVEIGEVVEFLLKDEKTLREKENFVDISKKTIGTSGTFKIGPEKKRLLGLSTSGTIGITKNFKPYIYTKEGWRFTEKEVLAIIKSDVKVETKDFSSGAFSYSSDKKELWVNGQFIDQDQIKELVYVLTGAGLL